MDLSEKINALENDMEEMRKNDKLQKLQADTAEQFDKVIDKINQIEIGNEAFDVNILNEINKYEHKVSYIEGQLKKELADQKNSLNSNAENISRLKTSISDKVCLKMQLKR